MMQMSLSQAAQDLEARFSGQDVQFCGIGTDSRTLERGELFVALHGPNFDGHNFIDAALQRGASAIMVDRADHYPCPTLQVSDTRRALGQLGAAWRNRFNIPLVAVTGSNGKTTVKEMLASILNQVGPTLATRGNYNNDIGMPLTLARLGVEHRFAVIEMGTSSPGEIDWLSRLAQPTVAVITQVAPAHLEGFGSLDAVAHAKAEIYNGLGERATAVINADDVYAPLWRELAGDHQQLEFSLESGQAGVHAEDIQLRRDGCYFVLCLPDNRVDVHLQLLGRHNVMNALAAAACAHAVGIDAVHIATGLAATQQVSGRLQLKQSGRGVSIIDDTYNANPGSLRAALGVLSEWSGERWLVLGDMGELGSGAAEMHRELGQLAASMGVDHLLGLGALSAGAVAAFGPGGIACDSLEHLLQQLNPAADACVLVKGSRSMRMERVVQALLHEEATAC